MIRHRTEQRGPLKAKPLQVAIVGMACSFPDLHDLFAFWKNAVVPMKTSKEVSITHWKPSIDHGLNSKTNGHVIGRPSFDLNSLNSFCSKSHNHKNRLLYDNKSDFLFVFDAVKSALDDAGLAGDILNGHRVEVIVGGGNNGNRGTETRLHPCRFIEQTMAIFESLHPEWSEEVLESIQADLTSSLPKFEAETFRGLPTNTIAGWVAEQFKLSGASFDVTTSSASSLFAVDLGAQSLVARRADLVLVAGVDTLVNADGTVTREGVGVLVLKRLADSERDGDRVYAVLQGVGLSCIGESNALAAPSAKAQIQAMRLAYRGSGIDPAEVDYVEGFTQGESAAEGAQLRALREVFPKDEQGRRVLSIVTSPINEAPSLAGMAGLIRGALALHHRTMLPTPTTNTPHTLHSYEASLFHLLPKSRPWINGNPSRPRRAGVNAFGIAGMNAHAILEEHGASADGVTPGCLLDWESEAILLGAPDRQGWITLATALIDWLDSAQNHRVSLKDLASTLNSGQGEFAFRVGLVVTSTDDLRQRLATMIKRLAEAKCQSVRDARGTYFWEQPLYPKGTLAFLYPGEGSQYPGMLADLCPHFPEIRSVLDTSDRIARERGLDRLPSEQLFGDVNCDDAGLWEIGTAVNVVLSSQWALHRLLSKIGLKPESVVGHSSGEILALAAAGVFEADQEFEDRIGALGAVFERLEESGLVPAASLVAVASGREKVEAFCQEHAPDVRIAIDNCPHQVVISGVAEAVALVTDQLRAAGQLCEPLPFSRAYHTSAFAPAIEPLREFFEKLPMKLPVVPVYSCASAKRMTPDVVSIRTLATRQWLSRVEFRDTVEAMHDDGVRLFVEVGSRGNLTGFVEDTLRGKPHFAIAANLPRRSGITQLNHLVASLYAQGVPLRPELLYARRRPRLIDFTHDLDIPREPASCASGFPTMRLSEGLVQRVRALRSDDDDRFLSDPLVGLSSSHPAFTSPRDLMNGKESGFTPTMPVNGSTKKHAMTKQAAPIGDAATKSTNSSLLTYFETMDAFLETQREVMEAYLRTGTGENHREAGPLKTRVTVQDIESKTNGNVDGSTPIEAQHARMKDTIEEVLLDLVSKRTGYTREMLDLDYDMEADLGIDSIKRVEIFGEIQERCVAADAIDLEKLSRCRTLAQVIDAMSRHQRQKPAGTEWFGTIETLTEGRELVALRRLDAETDPVARHHTLGGRHVSDIDLQRLGLPVVPFTVMAEILAQAAAILVPGKVVVGMRELLASRWLSYEPGPVELEVRANRDPLKPEEVRVEIRNRSLHEQKKNGSGEPTFSGTVLLAPSRPLAEPSDGWNSDNPRSCRFQAEELYRDQWLFHGPAFQALTHVGNSSGSAIDGTLKVLPRRELLPESIWPRLHTDPIVLDAFTHLLGCWGIDKQGGDEGDVMFPLRLAGLSILGDDPEIGTELVCQIQIKEVTRHRVKVDAEIVRPDGRVWYRLEGWEDWRFYWPGRFRDVFRQPKTVLLGEQIEHPAIPVDSALVWFDPPADMGKPVWKDVLEWVQLCPRERAEFAAHSLSKEDLFACIAAKDVARRLWLRSGDDAVYPADLVVLTGHDGRKRVSKLQNSESMLVAYATCEGLAIAFATNLAHATIGVAVSPRSDNFSIDLLSGEERVRLSDFAHEAFDVQEWLARIAAAKRALKQTFGANDLPDPTFQSINLDTGEIRLGRGELSIRCFSFLRAEHVAAWTLGERFAT